MKSDYSNFIVLLLIIIWSLVIFFTRPKSIYDSRLRRTTFHFWLAFWFASAFFYLVRYFHLSPSLPMLALQLSVTDVNSILMLAIYFSYTRAREFTTGDFLRTWVPLFGTMALYEFLWAVFGKDADPSQHTAIRVLMLTPSLGLGMLASFSLGWGFYLRHRKEVIIFPFVSAVWALIQLPLYILHFVLGDEATVARLLWFLVFLKVLIAMMFFYYIITLPHIPEDEESVFRQERAVNIALTPAIKRWAKLILASASGVLALIKIIEWIKEAFF